jgi:hypothetical protein
VENTDLDVDARFIFEFSHSALDDSGAIMLDEAELQTMGAVGSCIIQLKKLIPNDLESKVYLNGGAIHLILKPMEDALQKTMFSNIPERAMQIIDQLNSALSKARANSQSEKPLPLAQVCPDRAYINLQQSLAKATASTGLQMCARVAGKEQALIQPTAEDFSAGREQVTKSKHVDMMVVGLIRNKRKEHELLLSTEEVRVQLPIDSWPWSRIRAALDIKTIFSGTIEKQDVGEPWIATADASLSQQEDAFVTEIGANDGDN